MKKDSTFYKYYDDLSNRLSVDHVETMESVARFSFSLSMMLFILCAALLSLFLIGYYSRPGEQAKDLFLKKPFFNKVKGASGRLFIWALVFLLVSVFIQNKF